MSPATKTRPEGDVPARGRFITFEGGEGSGKSTQVQRLLARLAGRGIETVATREPGGSPEAERLRKLLLSGAVASLGPVAEIIVFAAARIDHLDKTIKPALAEGCFVICDRFTDSTRAYQGATGKVDMALVRELETIAADAKPDLTIILDVPAEIGLARAKGRGEGADRFESEALAFHEAVRQSFLDTAREEPERCAVIDATLPADEISEVIWKLVEDRLLLKSKKARRTPAKKRARNLRVIDGSAPRKDDAGAQSSAGEHAGEEKR